MRIRNIVQESFVSFETAKLLKKAGFGLDIGCDRYDEDGCFLAYGIPAQGEKFPRPSLALAFAWLRERGYNFSIFIEHITEYEDVCSYTGNVFHGKDHIIYSTEEPKDYDTTLEECIVFSCKDIIARKEGKK